MPIRCLIRPAGSEDFEAQQRLIVPVRSVVIKRAEAHRFEFRHASRSPLVQELTYEAELVDLVIVLARRKREQLCFQVRQHGARAGTYKPSSSIRPRMLCARTALLWRVGNCSRFVYACRSRACGNERTYAGGDLGFLFRTKRRLPLGHQIAPCLDPHIRRGLLSPEVEQKHPTLPRDAKYDGRPPVQVHAMMGI